MEKQQQQQQQQITRAHSVMFMIIFVVVHINIYESAKLEVVYVWNFKVYILYIGMQFLFTSV